MMMKTEVTVEHTSRNVIFHTCSESGEKLASILIPMSDRDDEKNWQWATMFECDFIDLIQENYSPDLVKMNGGPVAAYDPLEDNFIHVKCFILEVGENEDVDYLDGDCFNLRRDNLAIVSELPSQSRAVPQPPSKGAPVLKSSGKGLQKGKVKIRDRRASGEALTLTEVIAKIERELPGWWWSCGMCKVSAHASVADEHASDEQLAFDKRFDTGFHEDLYHEQEQVFTPAEALLSCLKQAKKAKAAYLAKKTLGGIVARKKSGAETSGKRHVATI